MFHIGTILIGISVLLYVTVIPISFYVAKKLIGLESNRFCLHHSNLSQAVETEFELPKQGCAFIDDEFSCECSNQYVSKTCELFVGCLPEPCFHLGTCLKEADGHVCKCTIGTEGQFCQLNIDECLSNPCMQSGFCQDFINGYFCVCQNGTKGNLCEIDIDECGSNPCQNGGFCADALNGYDCYCPAATFGSNCQHSTACASNKIIGHSFYNFTPYMDQFLTVYDNYVFTAGRHSGFGCNVSVYHLSLGSSNALNLYKNFNFWNANKITAAAFSAWLNTFFFALDSTTLMAMNMSNSSVTNHSGTLLAATDKPVADIWQMVCMENKLIFTEWNSGFVMFYNGSFHRTSISLQKKQRSLLYLVETQSTFGFSVVSYTAADNIEYVLYDSSFQPTKAPTIINVFNKIANDTRALVYGRRRPFRQFLFDKCEYFVIISISEEVGDGYIALQTYKSGLDADKSMLNL